MMRKALREAVGHRAAAARQLGSHRQLLYSKVGGCVWNASLPQPWPGLQRAFMC